MNTEPLWLAPLDIERSLMLAAKLLKKDGHNSTPRLDAELLLAHVLRVRRIDLYIKSKDLLEPDQIEKFKNYISRRIKEEPIAYILGVKSFMAYDFFVNEHVLIPRPETELLVEEFTKDRQEHSLSHKTIESVLDVGCGSACVSLTLAKMNHDLSVVGIDISSEALKVARKNSEHLLVDDQKVLFKQVDFLDETQWPSLGQFDVVVSNPPYISQSEAKDLLPSVINFEPKLALFAEEDGLLFYRLLARFAMKSAKAKRIYLEIGYSQAEKVSAMLRDHGWANIAVKKDLSGNDRLVVGWL